MRPRSTTPRWVDLIPLVVLGGAFGVMAAIHPNTVRDLFSGTQAVLVTLGIVAGWLLLSRLVLPRVVGNGWVRVGVLSVVAVGLVLMLILPSVVDKKVVEELPAVATKAVDDAAPSAPVTSTTAAGPVRIAAGAIHGLGHDATGTAVLYRQPDGGVLLDDLRGNQGTQYYPVPAGTDLDADEWTVLVWCRTYAVPVAGATLA